MSELGLTPDRLFLDPQLLTQYLEEIAVEIQTPYEERNELFKNQEITTQVKDIMDEVNRKDAQLKLLIGFIGLLMDKSEEKMRSQIEKLEKQDTEIITLKEENTTTKDELQMTKQLYKDLETKVKEMEFVLNETEQKSEGDKQHLMDALNKIQSLSEIKDKYEDLEEKSAKSSRIFDKLNEEKSELEFKIETLTKEKSQLKKEFDLANHKAEEFDNLLVEYNKLDVKYDKLSKEYESERIEFKTKKNAMQAEITLLQDKIEGLQEEIFNLKKSSIPKIITQRVNSTDDPQENKNSRLSNVPFNFLPLDSTNQSLMEEFVLDNYNNPQVSNSLGNFTFDNMREGLSSSPAKPIASVDIIEEKTEPESKSELKITSCSSIKADPSSPSLKRKDIFEEFFSLSFQSALLNSPYFDDLAGTDSKSLYDEVSKKGIPFHKWYTWIVARLAHIHQEEIVPQMSGWIGGQKKK